MKPKKWSQSGSEMQTQSLSSKRAKAYSLKLHCLFCYKLVEQFCGDERKKTPAEIEGERRERITVCSRLYSHVSDRREEGDKWNVRSANCGVCDDCFYMIEEHSKIYEEIEYLKLRLRWQLDKFYKVMKYAGKVASRVKAFKESFQQIVVEANNERCGDGTFDILGEEVMENCDKVMGRRQMIYDACFKRLKIKNPKVTLQSLTGPGSSDALPVSPKLNSNRDANDLYTPDQPNHNPKVAVASLKKTLSSEGHRINREVSRNHDASCNGNQNSQVPEQPDPLQLSDPEENEVGDNIDFDANGDDDSNREVMYIIKTEGEDEDGDFQKIVTPPESILEALRSGDVPLEGVSKNHYFYCTPAKAPRVEEDSLRSPLAVNGNNNEGEEARRQGIPGTENLDGDGLSRNPAPLYKCIKCSKTFPSEAALVSHARDATCFTAENILLKCSPSSNCEENDSSRKFKRKRSPETSFEEQSLKRKQTCEDATAVLAPKDGKSSEISTLSGNVVASAIEKVLALRSMFKCPNCSETFSSEVKYKSHVIARECFKEKSKRRSCSKADGESGKEKSGFFSDDDEQSGSDTDLSSMSSSSHEENSDADYAPKHGKKGSRKKTKRRNGSKGVMKDKDIVKTHCPKANCNKFFLYREDLERHLKNHAYFSCKFCVFATDRASEVASHEIENHSEKDSDNRVICPRCPNSKILNSDKHRQTDHYVRRHLTPGNCGKKENECNAQCRKCGAVMSAKSRSQVEYSLNRHMKSVHKK